MTLPVLMMLPGLLCNEITWAAQVAALPRLQCVVPSYGRLDSIGAVEERITY
jgi:hypothetical protein